MPTNYTCYINIAKLGLANHMGLEFILCHITPLIIYSLGVDTHISTHIDDPHKIIYRKPGMFG